MRYAPDVFNKDCPSRRVLGRIADRWAALIICALHERAPMRNGELMRVVDGITQKMLTQTLRNLETDGLVARTVFDTVPPRVEYRLTALGQGVYKPLAELCQWTESNLDELKRIWQEAASRVERS
jgi:DNA-binding HxlR family transcriptional regulator